MKENKLEYTTVGEIQLPNITIPEPSEMVTPGVWARRRKEYLKKYHPALLEVYRVSGTLNQHISDVETKATESYERLMNQYHDQMRKDSTMPEQGTHEWAAMMNNFAQDAREIVMNGFICQEPTSEFLIEITTL